MGASTLRGPAGPAAVPAAKPLPGQLPAVVVATGAPQRPGQCQHRVGWGVGRCPPVFWWPPFLTPPIVFFPQESRNLFCCLYRSWCHNPVTTVSLCFLTQNYKHAYDLIQKLYPSGGALPGCRRDGAVLAGCLPAPLPFFFLVM